jgi:hypothetical protein
MPPGGNVIKSFSLSLMKGHNKLECFSLAKIPGLVECLEVRQRAYPRKENLSVATLGYAPDLLGNIRLG